MGSHSYDYPKGNPINFLIAGFLFVIFLLCLIFSSCAPAKRLGAISAKHPDAARRVCVAMFPPEIKTVTDTKYLQGETIYDTAMVYVDCDSVVKLAKTDPRIIVKQVKVPCPPSSHRVDSVFKNTTVTIINKEKERVLEQDLAKSEAKADKLKHARNNWRWVAAGLALLLAAVVGSKFLFGKFKAAKTIIDKTKE